MWALAEFNVNVAAAIVYFQITDGQNLCAIKTRSRQDKQMKQKSKELNNKCLTCLKIKTKSVGLNSFSDLTRKLYLLVF